MKIFFLIITLSLILFSCGEKEEAEEETSSTTEFEGTWETSCHSCYWSSSHSCIETITVAGSALVRKWDEHSDSSCSNDYAIWTDNHISLSLGNEVTLDNGSKGQKFTMKVDSLEGILQTSAAVTYYNNNNFCDVSDYALNTTFDYAGKTCFSVTYPAKNDTVTGVYKLDGSSLLINTDNITSVGSTVFTKQ